MKYLMKHLKNGQQQNKNKFCEETRKPPARVALATSRLQVSRNSYYATEAQLKRKELHLKKFWLKRTRN